MKRFLQTSLRVAVLACASALTAACGSDASNPVAPPAPVVAAVQSGSQDASQSGALGTVVGGVLDNTLSTVKRLPGTLVNVLGRLIPLQQSVTVSKVIGPRGGEITIVATGLQIIVPPGAVDSNVVFSVTALAGKSVAYEFSPHGVQFKQPLIFRQNLGRTLWLPGLQLQGAYFKNNSQVDTDGKKATVDERLPIEVQGGWATFKIWHFSGYLVSCA